MLKNSFVLFIVLLFIGGGLYYQFGSLSSQNSVDEIRKQVKEELVSLTLKDFEEYQKLKTLEERYQKADEILGKIFTVFLADLSLRIAHRPLAVQDLATDTKPTENTSAAKIPVATVEHTPTTEPSPSPAYSVTPLLNPEAANPINPPPVTAAPEVRSSTVAFRLAKPINAKLAEMFLGRFIGDIRFTGGGKASWLLEVETGISSRPNSYASISIRNTGNEKVVFRQNYNRSGYQRVFRSMGPYILITLPTNSFLQLRRVADDNQRWQGDYYQRGTTGNYELQGEVVLVRQ